MIARNRWQTIHCYYSSTILLLYCLITISQASSHYKNQNGSNSRRTKHQSTNSQRRRPSSSSSSSSQRPPNKNHYSQLYEDDYSILDSYHHSSELPTSSSSQSSSSAASYSSLKSLNVLSYDDDWNVLEESKLDEDEKDDDSNKDDNDEDRIIEALDLMEEREKSQQQQRRKEKGNISRTSRQRRSHKSNPRRKGQKKKKPSTKLSRSSKRRPNPSSYKRDSAITPRSKSSSDQEAALAPIRKTEVVKNTNTETKTNEGVTASMKGSSSSAPTPSSSVIPSSMASSVADQSRRRRLPASPVVIANNKAMASSSSSSSFASSSSTMHSTSLSTPSSSRVTNGLPTSPSSQQQQKESIGGLRSPSNPRISPTTSRNRHEGIPKSTATPPTSRTTMASSSSPPPRRPMPIPKAQPQQPHNPTIAASTTTSTTTGTNTTPWIRKFLSARTKDMLFPIPKEYLSDGFNLAQLAPIVERIGFQAMGESAVDIAHQLAELNKQQQHSTSYPIYRLALQSILNDDDDGMISHHPLIGPDIIQIAAEALYLLVHARFAASPRGLEALRRVMLTSSSSTSSGVFGKCPRSSCHGCMLLPYGVSNNYSSNESKCLRYCPCCGESWMFWESRTDGCAWGNSLSHLLLLTHGNELYNINSHNQNNKILSETTTKKTTSARQPVVPRVMGFRIHPATTWGKPLLTDDTVE